MPPVREALARWLDPDCSMPSGCGSTSSANAPKRMQRRQDLEEGERTASEYYHHDDGDVPLSPFLSAQEAVRLLGAGDRSVACMAAMAGYNPQRPDPLGSLSSGACAPLLTRAQGSTHQAACFGTLRVCTSGHVDGSGG